ncbi:MAG: hypothetical protein IBX68_01220, partial [Dehalococcoidia bacterium]|nr:hypothetical protein [Dehalococcoidia bacterium]
MKRILFVTVVLIVLGGLAGGLTALAQGGGSESDDQDGIAWRSIPAPIHEVEILAAESYPVQYFARVVSGLHNGCVKFGSYEASRQGQVIKIEVINMEPVVSMPCIELYGFVETSIPLGSDFTPGVTYTVIV